MTSLVKRNEINDFHCERLHWQSKSNHWNSPATPTLFRRAESGFVLIRKLSRLILTVNTIINYSQRQPDRLKRLLPSLERNRRARPSLFVTLLLIRPSFYISFFHFLDNCFFFLFLIFFKLSVCFFFLQFSCILGEFFQFHNIHCFICF